MVDISLLEKKILSGDYVEVDEISGWSVADVSAFLLNTLSVTSESNDAGGYWRATFLLRDVVIVASGQAAQSHPFRASWQMGDQVQLREKIESGLGHRNLKIRKHAVYTLGKLCSTNSLNVLLDVFRHSMLDDPALLLNLVFEIVWIAGSADPPKQDRAYDQWSLVKQLCHSDRFVNRWAGLEVAQGMEPEKHHRELMESLRDDPHPFVHYQSLNPEDARNRRVNFGLIVTMFAESHSEYSVEEFEAFIDQWIRQYAPDIETRS